MKLPTQLLASFAAAAFCTNALAPPAFSQVLTGEVEQAPLEFATYTVNFGSPVRSPVVFVGDPIDFPMKEMVFLAGPQSIWTLTPGTPNAFTSPLVPPLVLPQLVDPVLEGPFYNGVIVLDRGTDLIYSVQFANGVGSVAATQAVGTGSVAITLGDFDADGTTDVVTADSSTCDLTVTRGNGTGGFQGPPTQGGTQLCFVEAMETGDMVGTPRLDLVLLTGSFGAESLRVLEGNGGGQFNPVQTLPFPPGTHITDLGLGDIDNDGDLDVVAPQDDPGGLWILRNGPTLLAPPVKVPIPTNGATTITQSDLLDLNGDGRLDIVVGLSLPLGGDVKILLQDPLGNFNGANAPGFPAGSEVRGLSHWDIDLDGALDLAVSVRVGVTTLFGDGSGGFRNVPIVLPMPPQVVDGIATDLDRDGRTDLAILDTFGDAVSRLLGDGQFGFAPQPPLFTNCPDPRNLFVDDLCEDGLADLEVGCASALLVGANGQGPLVSGLGVAGGHCYLGFSAGPTPQRDVLGFFDNPPRLQVLDGIGCGLFAPGATVALPGLPVNPRAVLRADIDNDGDRDILFAAPNAIVVCPIGANGLPQPSFSLPLGVTSGSLSVGDVDRNGLLDLAVAVPALDEVRLLLQGPAGVFVPAPPLLLPVTSAVSSATLFDFDGDTWIDLLAVNPGTGLLTLFRNDGAGLLLPWSSHPIFLPSPFTGFLPPPIVADFDADGDWDVGVFAPQGLSIFSNQTGENAGNVPYGTGTPGCNGRLGVSYAEEPKVGGVLTIVCTGAPPSSLGLGLATSFPLFPGADIFGIGLTLEVDLLLSPQLHALDLFSDPLGVGGALIPIPPDPQLSGLTLALQAVWVQPPGDTCTASMFGLESSRGGSFTIGN